MSAAYMRRCARKKRYESKEAAVTARAAMADRSASPMNAYRCDQCLGWHVGRGNGHYVSRNRTGKRPNKRMRGRI